MTIDYVVKKQAIDLHLQGRGRNEICRILNGQKMRISEATITHLIQDWNKRQQQQAKSNNSNLEPSNQLNESGQGQVQYQTSVSSFAISKEQLKDKTQETITTTISLKTPESSDIKSSEPEAQQLHPTQQEQIINTSLSTNNTYTDDGRIDSTGTPLSTSTSPGSGLEPVLNELANESKNSGAPLSFFLNISTATTVDDSVPEFPAGVLSSIEEETCDIEAAARPQQHQEELVVNVKDVLEPEDLSLEPEELKSLPEADRMVPGPRSIEDRLEQGRKMWDCYGPAWTLISKQIGKERDQRRHELFLMDRRKIKLEEWRKRLEQMQYDLTIREGRILESEAFLPLAKKLQEMKLTLEEALPWLETIHEKAEVENVDIRTAAVQLAQELKLYRQFGGLDRTVKQLEGELKMLDMSIAQKQPVITTILKLQQHGVKDDDIIGLNKIIDLSRMGKEWTPFGSNPKSDMGPLQSNPGNNGYGGGNLSMNDLIKLNLLKTTSTNMLNRMGSSG